MLSMNLRYLRKTLGLSQEQAAERVGVSRQAVAKWERGETVPDLTSCIALAALYNVSLDDLVQYDSTAMKAPIPPKGKHMFGVVKMGERGQIVIPKKARNLFGIGPGDSLLVLGDEAQGIAIVKAEDFLTLPRMLMDLLNADEKELSRPEERT